MKPQSRRSTAGFTLIELMFTVALAGVMLIIGVPSFNSFIAGQRVKTAAADLSAALSVARSEAIKRNVNVQLLVLDDDEGLQSGWKVRYESPPGTERVVLTQSAMPRLAFATVPDDFVSVTYSRAGRPVFDPVLAANKATVEISAAGADAMCVMIDPAGMPSTKRASC